MKIVIGLGNPGKEYEKTRHNIGFILIDEFAKSHNINIDKSKFNGLFVKTKINGEDVILLKPESFMNLSGEVTRKFVEYFNINTENILIISDDLDQPSGEYKLKENGTSGGHNGLKNVELHLATREYKRLKLGISNNKQISTKNYVLSKLNKDDLDLFNNNLNDLISLLNDFLTTDFQKLMAIYNYKGKNVK